MTWTARNNGLTGTDLEVSYIVQSPATRHLLDSSFHELWAATNGGLFFTFNGGREWAKMPLPIPSNAQFEDVPPPTLEGVEWIWVDYDPLDSQTVYALAALPGSSRMWIYKTTDSGLTWISRGLVA